MQENSSSGLPQGGLRTREVAGLIADLAVADADDARIREVAARYFRSQVARVDHAAVLEVIAGERAGLRERIAANQKAVRGLDPVITVASSEEVCEPHWVKRVAGSALGLVAIAMLMPIPIVVASGMAESDAIAIVFEDPRVGLLYGIAPIGAALSVHGIKTSFRSAIWRKVLDQIIYGSAVVAACAWALLFGPTFLEDAASGFGAAAQSQASLSDWYTAQLAMEFTGGAACLTAAMDYLMGASTPVSKPNPAREAIGGVIDADLARANELAAKADAINAKAESYETACNAFVDRCLVHVDAAKKLLAGQAAADAKAAIAEVRQTLNTIITTEDQHA